MRKPARNDMAGFFLFLLNLLVSLLPANYSNERIAFLMISIASRS